MTSSSTMATQPEREEVYALNSDVTPGWIYDKVERKLIPPHDYHHTSTQLCPPRYKFFTLKKELIDDVLKKHEVYQQRRWVREYNNMKGEDGDVILLEGSKIVEHKGCDIQPHNEDHIVSSVNYRYCADMLVHFSCNINDLVVYDLRQYLLDVVSGVAVSRIPREVCSAFTHAYIYPEGEDGRKVTGSKHGWQEFCRLLMESEPSKYPFTASLLAPVSCTSVASTYASVVRTTVWSNSTNISSTTQKQDVSQSSCAISSTNDVIDIKTTIKFESNKPKIQVLVSENNFDCGGHSVIVNIRDGKMASTTSSAENLPLHDHGDSNSCLATSKQLLPTEGRQESGNEGTSGKAQEETCSSSNLYPNLKRIFVSDDTEVCEDEVRAEKRSSDLVTVEAEQDIHVEESSRGKNDIQEVLCTSEKDEEGESSGSPSAKVLVNEPRLSFEETRGSEVGSSTTKDLSEGTFQGFRKESVSEDEGNITPLSGYLKPLEEGYEACGMTRKYYGVHSDKTHKTIILLGASGSGKTTLVNFVANYFRGVKSAGGELVHVIRSSNDVKSRTTSITAYTFCDGEEDVPITVIDTPGLNDSSGAEVRDHVQSLKTFLANAASQNYEIHAIGFVAQAHLVRLTSSERLVMDYVSTLFGEDITDHFITFVTFADSQETPPVVEAMKNYGVRCNLFLKFNNSAISTDKNNEIDALDIAYWKLGRKNWKKCLKSLQSLPALSVNTMKALQNEMYTTTVIESTERDLRAELKTYINYIKNLKQNLKQVLHTGEQVWELTAALKCLKSIEISYPLKTESILTQFAEEVCKEKGYDPLNCIHLLSLTPSRKLLKAGVGVLRSMAPLYKFVDDSCRSKTTTNSKHVREVLYCVDCKEDHILGRPKPGLMSSMPVVGSDPSLITYKCTQCPCDGIKHLIRSQDQDPSQSSAVSVNKVLDLTKSSLTKVMSQFSIPEYPVNVQYFLNYIIDFTSYDFTVFIKNLQKMIK
ncbi:uncharacterized protein LOC121872895 isoform X1 [Homarus americanus]|uniref:uncharacterized protein LOC121872895 isoform X1 n=1 Tax=Homarus americanus TaxID=6706 RepID=UPI001C45743B|nr:uncharacterized protein LOC121872895 isoform X1 [Homarus americanus]